MPALEGNLGRVYSVAVSPDGALIAIGGWLGWTARHQSEAILLFDRRNGTLKQIARVPNVVFQLVFSRDGSILAATIPKDGLRIFSRETGWKEVASKGSSVDSYAADFATDGRLAWATYDGRLRLYDSGLLRTVEEVNLQSGKWPYQAAFSPDGSKIAIGYDDSGALDVLNSEPLKIIPSLSSIGEDGDRSNAIAWSQDGATVYIAGLATGPNNTQTIRSRSVTESKSIDTPARDRIMWIVSLPGGDVLVASADPLLARLHPDGSYTWAQESPIANFHSEFDKLSVSSDGTQVEFGFGGTKEAGRFRVDIDSRVMQPVPAASITVTPPRQDTLAIKAWHNDFHPTLDGKPLTLEENEMSLSLAIDKDNRRFAIGGEWSLQTFDTNRHLIWKRRQPSLVEAVNITGDGRLLLTALSDGTIRWYRMTDGAELLAFMPQPNHTDWVAWTPEGFYAATPGAHGILRWHVNRGWDSAADSIPVQDIPGSYRPEVLPLVLQELETPRALGLAMLAEHNREIAIRTHSQVPPGAQLHLLTVGISNYNEDYAKRLRLHYADRDAQDLASAIVNTQSSLYARVNPQVLRNKQATKDGIMRALAFMRSGMERGGGNDLAVVHFSGHGALIDGKLYLLPYDVDDRDNVGIKSRGLWIEDLKGELMALVKHGRVLVLLDACHSGATTNEGAPIAMDSKKLRTDLAGANITVLTSSSGGEDSIERPEWQHGAFTKALLDALGDPAADADHNGLINANALAHYVAQHVASMTGGGQTPGMEVRYEGTLFASSR